MGGETTKPNDANRDHDATAAYSLSDANTVAFRSSDSGRAAQRFLLAGEFGRYRIVRQLGAGAMGAVYLAHDTQLDRQVALKTPSFGGSPEPEAIQRFYREARLAATLRHPNICPIYDVGEFEGVHFITMAYIEGRPLSEYIRPEKHVPQHGAAMVVRKLALALQHAHDQGVIHRDLKPANIMVDKSREPIVMDFGLARRADNADQTLKTQIGIIMGTPLYMSPEQVEGEPDRVGPASDQYSLGVILYELLTSQRPFTGSFAAVVSKIITQPPPPLIEQRPDVAPALEAICRKMLAKQAADRYDTLKEAADALGAYVKDSIRASAATRIESSATETDLTEDDFPDTPENAGQRSDSPSSRRAAKIADADLAEFLALQSLEQTAPIAVDEQSPQALVRSARPSPTVSRILTWAVPAAALAMVVLLAAFLLMGGSRESEIDDATEFAKTPPLAEAARPVAGPGVEVSAPTRSAVYRANEWIDVIPLIDPNRDKDDYSSTGANIWHKRNNELTFISDGKAGKLLFPLILRGSSLEWEIEFTRFHKAGHFATHVPAASGFVMVEAGRENGRYSDRIALATAQDGTAAWSGECDVENGKRVTLKIRVERIQETDRIEIFVNGNSRGAWWGDRELLARFPITEYRTDERIGIFVAKGGEYTFHRVHLRMLEGQALPIEAGAMESNDWKALFNGRDLSGWRPQGEGRWTVENGAIMAAGNADGKLVHEEMYHNFELTLEVLADPQGNGGVFFHLPSSGQHDQQSYELQLAGSQGDGGNNYTGGIYEGGAIAQRVNPSVAPDGQWVSLRLRVAGLRIQSWVDGNLLADIQGKPIRLPGGFLALQGRPMAPGVRVGYRNIRIRRLSSAKDE